MKFELHALLESFGQEQAHYTALLDLSRQQKEVILAGDIDQLLALLARKQRVLEEVARIERELADSKRHWKDVRARLSEDDRCVLDVALATVEELLAELISLERESEQLLAKERGQTAEALAATTRGVDVARAYGAGMKTDQSRFLDVRPLDHGVTE